MRVKETTMWSTQEWVQPKEGSKPVAGQDTQQSMGCACSQKLDPCTGKLYKNPP